MKKKSVSKIKGISHVKCYEEIKQELFWLSNKSESQIRVARGMIESNRNSDTVRINNFFKSLVLKETKSSWPFILKYSFPFRRARCSVMAAKYKGNNQGSRLLKLIIMYAGSQKRMISSTCQFRISCLNLSAKKSK